jgi:hypothetical protein
MTNERRPAVTVELLEYGLKYAALLTVHYSPEYGAWLRRLELALDEARKDDPMSRAAQLLAAISKKVA